MITETLGGVRRRDALSPVLVLDAIADQWQELDRRKKNWAI